MRRRGAGYAQDRRRGESRLELLVDLLKLRCLDGPDQDVSSDPEHDKQQAGGNTQP